MNGRQENRIAGPYAFYTTKFTKTLATGGWLGLKSGASAAEKFNVLAWASPPVRRGVR